MKPLVYMTIADVSARDMAAFTLDNGMVWTQGQTIEFDPTELTPAGEFDYPEIAALLINATCGIEEEDLRDYGINIIAAPLKGANDVVRMYVTLTNEAYFGDCEVSVTLPNGDTLEHIIEDDDEAVVGLYETLRDTREELNAARVYITKLEEQLNKQDLKPRQDQEAERRSAWLPPSK